MIAAPKSGDLRVWWIPQIPGKPFHVPVASPAEAKKIMDVLAQYDLFQYANHIKPDYSNAGGLECFQQDGPEYEPEWCEWYDEFGGDIADYEVPA